VTGAAAQESLCASVKIEIQQEVTAEREAFLARMRIVNGLDTLPLQNLEVAVTFVTSARKASPAAKREREIIGGICPRNTQLGAAAMEKAIAYSRARWRMGEASRHCVVHVGSSLVLP
jgi:hypothetical protein